MKFYFYTFSFLMLSTATASALEDRTAHFKVSYHMGGQPSSQFNLHQRGLNYVKKNLEGLEPAAKQAAPTFQQSSIIITTELPAAFCEIYADQCLPRRVMLYNNIVRIENWDNTTSYYKDSKNIAEILWQQGDPIYLKMLRKEQ